MAETGDLRGTLGVRHKGRGVMLTELLRQLVEASPDFEGAVVVSMDGLVMAAYSAYDPQTETGSAELIEGLDDSDAGAVATRAFELSDEATEALEQGGLRRLILVGSDGNVIITQAGPHALCVVLLKPEAKVGIASFEAARISVEIARVLE